MDVRRVETDDELEEALAVRRSVFIEEQGVPEHRELDGRDDEAIHVIAYDGGSAVGTGRLREYDDRTGKIERVAVLEAERSDGIGQELMAALEEAAVEDGFDSVLLHAQVPVVEFYRGLDYETTSEEFEDAGIPHREMRKRLD